MADSDGSHLLLSLHPQLQERLQTSERVFSSSWRRRQLGSSPTYDNLGKPWTTVNQFDQPPKSPPLSTRATFSPLLELHWLVRQHRTTVQKGLQRSVVFHPCSRGHATNAFTINKVAVVRLSVSLYYCCRLKFEVWIPDRLKPRSGGWQNNCFERYSHRPPVLNHHKPPGRMFFGCTTSSMKAASANGKGHCLSHVLTLCSVSAFLPQPWTSMWVLPTNRERLCCSSNCF